MRRTAINDGKTQVGLSGALETLCGQGFGAKLYKILGVYLQSSCLISLFFSILISILWIFTEPILVLLHQKPEIAKLSAAYIQFLIPGLFAYGLLNNMLRFLQTQSIVAPLVLCSMVPLALHFGIAYLLVQRTSLAFVGAPLAASISLWISTLMLASYVLFNDKLKETWHGFSMEAFHHIFTTLKLAVPSAAMLRVLGFRVACVTGRAYAEFGNIDFVDCDVCKYRSNRVQSYIWPQRCCKDKNSNKLQTIWTKTSNSKQWGRRSQLLSNHRDENRNLLKNNFFIQPDTRVSNELGAGKIDRAKHAMGVTIKLSIVLALVVVIVLGFGHNIWAGFFSNSPVIIGHYASMTPFLLISIILDAIQGVFSGAARGCGWQHFAVFINLGMFYLIGMPIAVLLAFLAKLYAKGLWIGLICGLGCQTSGLLLLMFLRKWTQVELD
ncbi:hypothetical protein OSB04_015521 [Centaurea solstitialis]|uniref:Protein DETOXIFICATION n=1 Tax=Centaurea solstitialis TaxID=347529 RepID=A0AA38TCK2_9ASTR|nr:hypothetical protein OSB04_015521 [Centaurea solstitialis]